MTGGHRFTAIGPNDSETDTQSEIAIAADEGPIGDDPFDDDYVDAGASEPRRRWLAPALACLAIAGWTAFFLYANRSAMIGGAAAGQWIGWIGQWTLPVLLVIGIWLLAMRHSTREAGRFRDAATDLRRESDALETRLITVNRELSLARDFIAAQSRDLESLGRLAGERLSQHADRLQDLVRDNGAQVDAIAGVSATALDNMERLRGDLPVIANSARDLASRIGQAGDTAHEHIDRLNGGFDTLQRSGRDSHANVDALRIQVEETLAAFVAQTDKIGEIVDRRFAALTRSSEAFRTELDRREADVLAAMRGRADALSGELANSGAVLEEQEEQALTSLRARLSSLRDEGGSIGRAMREHEMRAVEDWRAAIAEVERADGIAHEQARERLAEIRREADDFDVSQGERDRIALAGIDQRRNAAADHERAAIAGLEERLAELDAQIAQRRDAQLAQTRLLGEHGEAITTRLNDLAIRMTEIAALGGTAEEGLSDGLVKLDRSLAENRKSLNAMDDDIRGLTDAGVRLLELLQGAARQTRDDLPANIGIAEDQLGAFSEHAETARLMLIDAGERGRALSEYVLSAQDTGRSALTDLDTLHARLGEHHATHEAQLGELQRGIAALGVETERVAGRAQVELRAAIAELEAATRNAVAALEGGTGEAVKAIADRIGGESADAIERALRVRSAEAIGQLEQAAAHASGVGREAAVQLRDQLTLVDELTGNLERRVNQARGRAEEQVDNGFARRVALITEALNSSAIDIAKALSTDVTDSAWGAYLRGDRGIFTRRAVRLLDNGEAREIANIYRDDDGFREHVSRYIHDFEAMLRNLLSTRDGHALGVTVLSSDMGKLYVALAQAIERLRN